jgi:nucleoside-triphosphatase
VTKLSASPANTLASFFYDTIPTGLWLVVGRRGAGKTTWCASVVQHAQQLGVTVGGVLCPAVFDDGVKTGIDLVDLSTGKRYALGRPHSHSCTGVRVGMWCLDAANVQRANQILDDATDADLVIIDELGPLEFEQDAGFQAGMRLLDQHCPRTALVVIRPELVVAAQIRWPHAEILTIEGGHDDSC